jgi:predicted Zn finger-like uncharacterized protein
MKFVCDRCQTKYSIADDRVRGKVLKVKCKTCGNVVTVREPGRHPSAAGLPNLSQPRAAAAPHAGGAATAAAAAVAVPSVAADAVDESERTMLAPNPMLMEGFGPPQPTAARRKSTGPLPPVAVPDDIVWYMALDGKRTGPFSKHQLVDKLVPLSKNADVHIWNEKLGDWKPPGQVPAVAAELAARKKAPPPPPPLGAPRRPTPPPMPPLASVGASHSQAHAHAPAHAAAHAHAPAHAAAHAHAPAPARRPTPHAPAGAPAMTASGAHPAHAKLPPPQGAGVQRPGLFSAAVPASAAPAEAGDPFSLLETPAPQPHMIHPPGATNGTGNGHTSRSTSSDVLQMLNMPGTPQTSPGAAPRLMSVAPATTWTPTAESSGRRNRSAQLILVLLGVVAVIIVVAVMGTMRQSKKSVAPSVPEPTTATAPTPPPPVKEEPPPPPPPPPVIETTTPGGKSKLGKGKLKPGAQPQRAGVAAPAGTPTPTATPVPPPPVDTTGGAASRFRDGRSLAINSGVSSRPPPSQADITKVISNNRGNIKTCYQRALLRDNTLTHGKIAVKLSIGISGRVKHVGLEGPAQFKTLEPCIKEVVQRWVFPQASEEYGTEFPLVFQGNE